MTLTWFSSTWEKGAFLWASASRMALFAHHTTPSGSAGQFLKRWWASEPPEEPVTTWAAGSAPRDSHSLGEGWSQGIYISKKLPDFFTSVSTVSLLLNLGNNTFFTGLLKGLEKDKIYKYIQSTKPQQKLTVNSHDGALLLRGFLEMTPEQSGRSSRN